MSKIKLKRFVPPDGFRKAVAQAIGVRLNTPESFQFGWLGAVSMKSKANEEFHEAFHRKNVNKMRMFQDIEPQSDVGLMAVCNGGSHVFLVLGSSADGLKNITGQMFSELDDITVELTDVVFADATREVATIS